MVLLRERGRSGFPRGGDPAARPHRILRAAAPRPGPPVLNRPGRKPMQTRTERDSLGPVEVPADRLWGAQTQRALDSFRISIERMPLPVVHALALVKKAVALVHLELGVLEETKAR